MVEHIHKIALEKRHRRRHANPALEIVHTLARKISFPFVDAVWINGLLKSAAWGNVGDETFTTLLRLSALRKEDDVAVDSEVPPGQDIDYTQQGEVDPQSPGGTVRPEDRTPEYVLFDLVLRNIKIRGEEEDGWQDDAVYGGLTAIRDIPGLRFCLPKDEFLETLSKAMEKPEENKWKKQGEDRGEDQAEDQEENRGDNQGDNRGENQGENRGENREENKGNKPFRVRKAAYDVVLAARDGWLKSPDLHETLERLDFPKKLHSVAVETSRSDHQCSFLEMMEILSEDRFWHPYLRREMGIWLALHREGPIHALQILTNVGELRRGDLDVDKSLEKVLEDEWAAVPGRPPMELTADILEPLAEVTKQFRALSFFTEGGRKGVLGWVEHVISSLEKRRDDDYDGPGDDIRRIIDDLRQTLRVPIQSTSRRFTYW